MKDKYTGDLCFIRTQNLKRNAADCDLCDVGIDSATCSVRDNCESNAYYKLAEEQPLKARKISLKLTGLNQDYEVVEEVIEIPDTGESVTTKESFFDCGARYDFKKEDPEKIQTEYKHNKERHDLICTNIKDHKNEADKLAVWLCNNKPEKWETCTKENTKVGDVVRVKKDNDIFKRVEYIFEDEGFNTSQDCVVNQITENGSYPAELNRYEINTYKNSDEL